MSAQKPKIFGQGQILFRQGETGGELFFIIKGQVELTVAADSGDKAVVAIMGEKQVLGIMSFLEGEPRSATAKALTDVECVVVNEAQRERLLDEIPPWFKALVKELSGNLRNLNVKFATLENRCKTLESQVEVYKRKIRENNAANKT